LQQEKQWLGLTSEGLCRFAIANNALCGDLKL
jgi:hypothetical protein